MLCNVTLSVINLIQLKKKNQDLYILSVCDFTLIFFLKNLLELYFYILHYVHNLVFVFLAIRYFTNNTDFSCNDFLSTFKADTETLIYFC